MMMILKRSSKAWNPRLQLPNLVLVHIQIHSLPALHKQFLHARNVKIIGIAFRPVRPTGTFAAAAVARARELGAEPKTALPIVEHLREVGTARVEIEAASPAVVHEALHVFPARVAVPPYLPRRSVEELEHAFAVEFVRETRSSHRA